MATVTCPGCGLPRAEDLTDAAPCPVCGLDGRVPDAGPPHEPDHDRPWVIDEQSAGPADPPHDLDPPRPTAAGGGRLLAGVLLGFLAGTAAGTAGVFGWQAYRDRPPTPAEPSFAQADPPADEPAPATPAPVAPAANPPAPPPGPTPDPVVLPKTPDAGPQPALANPFRPAAPRGVRLDGAQTYAPFVEPGKTVVARGRVKRLVVGNLDAGAVLDCSEMDAEEVVVIGRIDGGSRLSVRAAGGQVTFRGRVVGKSKVSVAAPDGTVTFLAAGEAGAEGAAIDGGAVVEVKARAAEFRGPIGGAGTRVAVTLTAGGSLAFAQLAGPSRLEYAKADPADPAPSLKKGTVHAPAVLVKVP